VDTMSSFGNYFYVCGGSTERLRHKFTFCGTDCGFLLVSHGSLNKVT